MQIDAHSKVIVGVTETKEFEENEDSPDVDELEKTGLHAHTTYTPTSILAEVAKGEGESEKSRVEITADQISANHDKASVLMDGTQISSQFGDKSQIILDDDQVQTKHDKAQLLLDAQQLLAKYDAKEIIIKSDGVYVGSGSANEPAILGNQLATLLIDWLSALSQMMTPTMMGPQPPANLAQFVSLQAKVNSYKASTSGILSKTVKIAQ